MNETVKFEVTDKVALITLNRPDSLNAINADLGRELHEALDRVRSDDIRAAVIAGAGRAFCAGADLKERAQTGGRREDASVAPVIETGRVHNIFREGFEKPLIAAVHGHCLAAGFELALACDLRVCATDACFGLPEIVRGFFPGGGGPQRLLRAIPQALAMEMILTGDAIDAETARSAGLVSRVISNDELVPTAMALAVRIASHAPLAVRAVKEVALASLDRPLDQAMRFGGAVRWIIGQTDDAKEGPRAFAEKRDPEYKGR